MLTYYVITVPSIGCGSGVNNDYTYFRVYLVVGYYTFGKAFRCCEEEIIFDWRLDNQPRQESTSFSHF